ncbi:MAG: tetratricopeptide repeat protein, partial [Bacteroidota bacterium]
MHDYKITLRPPLACLLLLLLGGFLFPVVATAQPHKTKIGLVRGSRAEVDRSTFLEQGEDYRRAADVYRRLIAAKGDKRFLPPPFYLAPDRGYIAFLEGDGHSIGLEKPALEVCLEQGEYADASIAFILAHELSHFYEKHQWGLEVTVNYQSPELNRTLDSMAKNLADTSYVPQIREDFSVAKKQLVMRRNEGEADYLGGFLAYSAGYPVINTPKLWGDLYERYGYGQDIPGYGSLDERKAQATITQDRLEEFIDIYEMANLLAAINRYADARFLYAFILEEYQGREVYNNLGVVTVLDALQYFDAEDTKYKLPLALDLSFGTSSRLPAADKVALREELLAEAAGYFRNAISLDPDYPPAYLNLACIHYLLKDYSRARFYASTEAQDTSRAATPQFRVTQRNADVLLALIAIREGKQDQAESLLTTWQDSSILARENLRLLLDPDGRSKSPRIRVPKWKIGEVESD